jgi:hypothetical protein
MSKGKLDTFSFASAAIGSMLVAAGITGVAHAGERNVKVYTTDRNKGGVLTAQINWVRDGNAYKGSIQGKYEDREADGYCVQGFKTGGKQRLPLGPPACPEGHSFEFNQRFTKAAKAAVEVCRVNNKTHALANCSGWK